jgi:hypothetical protein
MLRTILRLAASLSLLAFIAGSTGGIRTAHAGGPGGWQLDLSGLSGLGFSTAPGDWSKAPEAPSAAAPAPQSAIEPAASTGETTGALAPPPASASVASADPATAILRLPSTGAGTEPNDNIMRLTLMIAAAGIACIGAARLAHARRLPT